MATHRIIKVPRRTRKKKPIIAYSKLVGVIVLLILITACAFTIYEVDKHGDLSPLPYMITGSFALVSAYVGFYINMAKAEHIEQQKAELEKEIKRLKGDMTEENREYMLEKLENISTKMEDILAPTEEEQLKEHINII